MNYYQIIVINDKKNDKKKPTNQDTLIQKSL